MNWAREQLLFDHLGAPALAYTLATDEQVVRGRFEMADAPPLEGVREDLLSQLMGFDAAFSNMQQSSLINYWAEQMGRRGEGAELSFGNHVRFLAGGEVYQPKVRPSKVENLLAAMVVDVYPALIVKELETPFPRFGGLPRLWLTLGVCSSQAATAVG